MHAIRLHRLALPMFCSRIGRAVACLAGFSALALATEAPASAYTTFNANSQGFVIPFAAGQTAEAAFIAALGGSPLTETLDALTPGAAAGQVLFGGLATITSAPGYGLATGGQCYNNTQCLQNNDVTSGWSLGFSTPVKGFGFWVNDQNTIGDFVTVLINGDATTLGPITQTEASSFYGFVASNPSEAISSLTFQSSNDGGFLPYDQFTTATYHNNVPGPLPLFGAATAFGMSRRLRRRLQQSR